MEVHNTSRVLIKELAEFLALEYSDTITPLDKIVESEELRVFYDDYGDYFDGLTIFDKKFFIHINLGRGNRRGSVRCRFTLAHELGHYFIENHRIGLLKGLLKPHASSNHIQKHFKIEREADYFASCILMPEKRFANDFKKKKFSFSIIEELSKKYNVSITACAVRFADIGNHPIMIVYCENNKVVWKWNSFDFPFKYLINDKIIPINSLAGEYFNDFSGKKRTEELTAEDWFKCYNKDDMKRMFFEHLIPFKNKSLSIIWED